MQKKLEGIDLPQTIFSLMFILIMIVTSFWVIRPFILGFAWASMVVIATWSFMLKLQNLLGGSRYLAVIIMIIILLLLFIAPVVFLINSLIDNGAPIINWLSSDNIQFPKFMWLQNIPIFGKKLFFNYNHLLDGGASELITKIQPYMGRTTEFFVIQAGHFGRFIIHLSCMLIFSTILYWHGEKAENTIRRFAFRLASQSGDAVVLLAGKAIRAVALGVVVTALVQGILAGIGLAVSGIPCASLLTILIILFCLIQIGPLPILIPAIIWLYWSNNAFLGTLLLVWSCIICILDNILRPMLIRIGVDLPILLILSGVIGGLLAFGLIGLFIGPVVLVISYRLVLAWIHKVPFPNYLKHDSEKKLLKKNVKRH